MEGRDEGRDVGVESKHMSGSNFHGRNLWENFSPEAITVRLKSSLFTDDTALLGEDCSQTTQPFLARRMK